MLSKGLMIFIFGCILFITTLIWIFTDIKNKDKRENKLLSRVILENSQGFKNNMYDTQLISETLELNDETEILENNIISDMDDTELLNDETEVLINN